MPLYWWAVPRDDPVMSPYPVRSWTGAALMRRGPPHWRRRRVAAFDGTMTLDSPVGGPTTPRVELPVP